MNISKKVDKTAKECFFLVLSNEDSLAFSVYQAVRKEIADLAESIRRQAYTEGLIDGKKEK